MAAIALPARASANSPATGYGRAAQRGVAGSHDAPVRSAQLDAQDLAGADQCRELRFETSLVRVGQRLVADQVGRSDVGVDERPGRGRVTADHVDEGGGPEVLPDER